MNNRIWQMTLLTAGFMLLIPNPSEAQQIRSTPLRANPYRDGGGSCVYDRAGKLVHTPRGKECRDRSDHSEDPGLDAFASLVDGFPPAVRADLRKLLGDHAHISEELTRLRQTIEAGERAEALEFADRVETEVAGHRRREEELLSKLSRRGKNR